MDRTETMKGQIVEIIRGFTDDLNYYELDRAAETIIERVFRPMLKDVSPLHWDSNDLEN